MALVFEQFLTASLGDASYLVGDDAVGVAVVIDPQRDVDRYLASARRHGLAIRHVVQTHTHEDFVSGARALAAAAGGAEVCVSGHAEEPYGFAHRALRDGDRLAVGGTCLRVVHTRGHTPEHIALLAAEAGRPEAPWGVFSGGALLVGAAGRTDLLGPERTAELTEAQFRTLRERFLALDDGVLLFPTHVHGSPCGAAIGDRTQSSIGHERRHNPLLQAADLTAFRRAALDPLPPRPSYYPRLKERNTQDPPESPTPPVRALPPAEFQRQLQQGDATLLDTRHLLAFGGGHVPGALNIGAAGHLAIQAGWMLEPGKPLLLVLEGDGAAATVVQHLARTGFERFAGYLAGGMTAWQDAGLPLAALPQLHVRELAQRLQDPAARLQVLDVRSPQEWDKGHVPRARHVFLPELPGALDRLERARPVAVYCDSGYRASIAASLLLANGFQAFNVPGSWQAWQALGLPVEQ